MNDYSARTSNLPTMSTPPRRIAPMKIGWAPRAFLQWCSMFFPRIIVRQSKVRKKKCKDRITMYMKTLCVCNIIFWNCTLEVSSAMLKGGQQGPGSAAHWVFLRFTYNCLYRFRNIKNSINYFLNSHSHSTLSKTSLSFQYQKTDGLWNKTFFRYLSR